MNNIEHQITKLEKTIQESSNTIQKLEIEKRKYIEEQRIVEEGYDIEKLNIYCKEITEFINQKKCLRNLDRCKGNCECDLYYEQIQKQSQRNKNMGRTHMLYVPTFKLTNHF